MLRLSALLVAAGLAVPARIGCAPLRHLRRLPGPDASGRITRPAGRWGPTGVASGPMTYSGPMVPGATVPAAPAGASLGGSVIDSAGPAPSVPAGPATAPAPPANSPFESKPGAPAGNAPSPPPPGDPAARTRPGS